MQLPGVVKRTRNKLSPGQRRILLKSWEGVNIGILNLNSFLLLYYRWGRSHGMKYVICAGAAAYAIIILFQSVFYRKNPRTMQIIHQTKTVFRLIYTAVYLTAIMLDVIAVAQMPGTEWMLVTYGWFFIWISIWGAKCLWLKSIVKLASRKFHVPFTWQQEGDCT